MPLVLPGNVASALGTGYDIDNSCRFNRSDSPSLTLTPGSNSASRTALTISFWFKRGVLAAGGDDIYTIFHTTTTNSGYIYLSINAAQQIDFTIQNNSYSSAPTTGFKERKITNRVFRDPSAWYHCVIEVDTTESTATDRLKIWINGTRESSWSHETNNTNQNQSLPVHVGSTSHEFNVGRQGNGSYYWDGYLAEFFYIDGTGYGASSFGEFDEDSPTIWKPKDCSGDLTFGTNGFYLDFEDSSNLGNDANGGTDFSENNIAAIDQTTDTPTNSFATLNPLAQTTDKGVISEGNLQFDESTDTNAWTAIASTLAASNGKWYFEYLVVDGGDSAGNGTQVGVINYDKDDFQNDASSDLSSSYGWYGPGNVFITGSDAGIMSSYTDGDIVCVAMDLDNNKIYWRKNADAWINSGDPTSGSTGTGAQTITDSSGSDFFAFAVSHREAGDGQANFGNPIATLSSGNADANGYGNFEHAPPSGYYAMCTKNLAEFG